TKDSAPPSSGAKFERWFKVATRLVTDQIRGGVARVTAILKSARVFVVLDEIARKDPERRERLYKLFSVDTLSASKVRTIADAWERLTAIGLEHLPLTREALYVLTLWLNEDEAAVRKAITNGALSQEST